MVYEWKIKYLYKKIYKIIYVVLVKDNENIVVKMVVNMKRVEILFFFLVDVLFLIIIFVILF